MVNQMNSSFPERWLFSYLNLTKLQCVTHIIGEPEYKYGQQEQEPQQKYRPGMVY